MLGAFILALLLEINALAGVHCPARLIEARLVQRRIVEDRSNAGDGAQGGLKIGIAVRGIQERDKSIPGLRMGLNGLLNLFTGRWWQCAGQFGRGNTSGSLRHGSLLVTG
jgi:hypothetical protein